MMRRPTSVEPVKAVLSTIGLTASSSPQVPPGPATMLATPGGRSASWKTSPSISAVSEVNDAGLSTGAVAGGQGRADLPRRHDEREVPRDDAGGHAVGLVADPVLRRRERGAGHLDLVGLLDRRSLANHAERADGAGHVGEHRLLDGAAAVAGLHLGELVGLGLDGVGDLVDLGAALGAAHLGPGALVERLAGGLDGA